MIKNTIIIFIGLFFFLLINGCQNNDDEIILKELKQQTKFLEEQLFYSKEFLSVKAHGTPSAKAYNKLYFKQDSVAMLYLKNLLKSDVDSIEKNYKAFIEQSNTYFNNAQNDSKTKLLLDDIPLTQLHFDSLIFQIHSDSLKIELIKQQILQRYFIIVQLYKETTSSCGIGFDNPNHFGFRLTIEKNKTETILNLKCFDPQRIPYFEKLEFISLSRNYKGDYYYEDELMDIKQQIIEFKQEKDAIIIKTKPLPVGFYRTYCNKLSISDNGRILKQNAEFDFEITENQ